MLLSAHPSDGLKSVQVYQFIANSCLSSLFQVRCSPPVSVLLFAIECLLSFSALFMLSVPAVVMWSATPASTRAKMAQLGLTARCTSTNQKTVNFLPSFLLSCLCLLLLSSWSSELMFLLGKLMMIVSLCVSDCCIVITSANKDPFSVSSPSYLLFHCVSSLMSSFCSLCFLVSAVVIPAFLLRSEFAEKKTFPTQIENFFPKSRVNHSCFYTRLFIFTGNVLLVTVMSSL